MSWNGGCALSLIRTGMQPAHRASPSRELRRAGKEGLVFRSLAGEEGGKGAWLGTHAIPVTPRGRRQNVDSPSDLCRTRWRPSWLYKIVRRPIVPGATPHPSLVRAKAPYPSSTSPLKMARYRRLDAPFTRDY